LGNHDLHYIDAKYRCSGFRDIAFYDLNFLFKDNIHLFQMSFLTKKYLFTHAGINKYFFDFLNNLHLENDMLRFNKILPNDYLERLEFLLSIRHDSLNYCSFERCGSYKFSSPTWCGMSELINNYTDCLPLQIVGHTHLKNIHITDHAHFIDVMCDESDYKFQIY
jgi:hypothetical protein